MVVVSVPFAQPVEGVLLTTPTTQLLVNNEEVGTATLYITESNVVWGGGVRPSGAPAPTISLLYPTISLHAIQREPISALFIILSCDLNVPGLAQNDDNDDDDFDGDHVPHTVIHFIPESENDVQAMYTAMKQGQVLNPDPLQEDMDNYEDPYVGEGDYGDDDGDYDEGDEEFEDAMESNTAVDDAATRMCHLTIENGHHSDVFEDAEIEE